MDTKEIKINVPEGYEIDKENSTFECIKLKPIQRKLPKTWGEFCKTHSVTEDERWITQSSSIVKTCCSDRCIYDDRNIYPNRELAEAALALCQLLQLRDYYNEGWQPDWTNFAERKYVIHCQSDIMVTSINSDVRRSMAFKSMELRDEFLQNFIGLLEIAKPLL